jgi:putative transposase
MEQQTQSSVYQIINPQPRGRPKTISDLYLKRLKELVSRSPRAYGYSFQKWTAHCLRQHLANELGLEISDRHVNRLLRQMGLSTRKQPNLSDHLPERLMHRTARITISDLHSSSLSRPG